MKPFVDFGTNKTPGQCDRGVHGAKYEELLDLVESLFQPWP